MPDVGVLNLKIAANAGGASRSLGTLNERLSDILTTIQNAADLSTFSDNLKKVADAVGKFANNDAVRKITALGNAMKSLMEASTKDSMKFPTDGIKELKSALGKKGLNLGQAGYQLRALVGAMKEFQGADGANNSLNNFATQVNTFKTEKTADTLRDVTSALKDYVSAAKELNSLGANASSIKETADVVKDAGRKIEKVTETVQSAGRQGGFGGFGAKGPMKIFRSAPTDLGGGNSQFNNVAQEIKKDTATVIEEYQRFVDATQKIDYTKVNLSDYVDSPMQAITDIYARAEQAVNNYGNALQIALPKVQAMTSEEMLIAGHARMATEAIENMINRLNAAIKLDNGIKFRDIVDWSNGIGKQMANAEESAMSYIQQDIENAKASLENAGDQLVEGIGEEATESSQGLSNVFLTVKDNIISVTSEIQNMNEALAETTELVGEGSIGSAITSLIGRLNNPENADRLFEEVVNIATGVVRDEAKSATHSGAIFNIPAMDTNGPFKYASDEVQHYSDLLQQAKADLEFWGQEYERIQKQIKYNGATDDRNNALAQSENSYYASLEKVEEYENALSSVYAHIAQYQELALRNTEAINNLINSTVAQDTRLQDLAAKNKAADEKRLEANYEQYRDAFMNGGAVWKEEVPKIYGFTAEAIEQCETYAEALKMTMNYVNQYVDEFIAKTNTSTGPLFRDAIDEAFNSKLANKDTADSAKFLEYALNAKEAGSAVREVAQSTMTFTEFMEKAISTGKELWGMFSEATFGAQGLKGAISRMFPTLSGLIKRFGQIAKYRLLRAVLRQITQGFKEGLENVYHYSKTVGTSFAPAMDSAASALAQMKNSLGAALAPVLQALIPVLQTVVNWFINLVNYANQFFALLTGQSEWTRAIPTTAEAFADTAKNAGSAGQKIKEAKDLLADWDELNIIQQEANNGSGGGSGGASKTAEDYKNMFEQVGEFDEGVRDVVNFIEDHMGGILELAKNIGILILGWKVSQAFGGILGQLGTLVAGGMMVMLGIQLSYGSGYEAGVKGHFDSEDILGAVGGILATTIGGALIGTAIPIPGAGIVGAVIGLTIGLIATFVGYVDGKKEAKKKSLWGDIDKTSEEIKRHVQEQFTFDVTAEIDVMHAQILDQENAYKQVETAYKQFSASVGDLRMGIAIGVDKEKMSAYAQQAYDDYLTLCSAVQENITKSETGLELTFKNMKFVDGQGNDISDGFLTTFKIANTDIMTYFKGLGEQMAHWISEGERTGWANDEAEQVLALMDSQQRIVQKALEARSELERQMEIQSGLRGVISYETANETAQTQFEQYNEWYAEAEELVRQDVLNAKQQQATLMAMADEEWAKGNYVEAWNYRGRASQLQPYIDSMLDEDTFREAVRDKMEGTVAIWNEEWSNTLRTVLGQGLTDELGDKFFSAFNFRYTFRNEYEELGTQGAVDAIGFQLKRMLEDLGLDENFLNLMEKLGVNIWSAIDEQTRNAIVDTVLEIVDPGDVKDVLMNAFGMAEDEAEKFERKAYEQARGRKKTDYMDRHMQALNDLEEMSKYAGFTSLDSFRQYKRSNRSFDDLERSLGLGKTNGYYAMMHPNTAIYDHVGREESLADFAEMLKYLDFTNLTSFRQYMNSGMSTDLLTRNPEYPAYNSSQAALRPYAALLAQGGAEGGLESNVEKGVKAGNADQNDLIRQLVTIVTQISNKQWTVNLNASSSMGAMAARSIDQFNRVRGEG